MPLRYIVSLVTSVVLLVICVMVTESERITTAPVEQTWTASVGAFNEVADIYAHSESDIWAVGSNVIHFDGRIWRAVDDQAFAIGYRAISFSSPGTGWAVGDQVVISMTDGVWSQPVALRGVYLQAVAAISDSEAWAVGAIGSDGATYGVIYHFSGGEWRLIEQLVDEGKELFGVWFRSPSDGWAVGDSGIILRFDGQRWIVQQGVERHPFFAVTGRGASDVWVGGGRRPGINDTGGEAVLVHFDGHIWSREPIDGNAAIVDFDMRADRGYAIGAKGIVYSLADDIWSALSTQVPADLFWRATSITVTPDGGEALVGRADGALFQIDLTTDEITSANALDDVLGVEFLSPLQAWAVSRKGALQFDGVSWRLAGPADAVSHAFDIDVAADGRSGWAVGAAGVILRLEDGNWVQTDSPTNVDLFRVWADLGPYVWVLGVRGFSVGGLRDSIVMRYDKSEWLILPDPPAAVRDVDVAPSGLAWIAAEDGLWWVDGAHWTKAAFNNSVFSVNVLSESEAWIGGKGTLYHFNEGCWDEYRVLPGGEPVSRIAMSSRDSGWAVAANGYVLRYNGSAWDAIRGPVDAPGQGSLPQMLFDLDVTTGPAGSRLWITGSAHSILSAPLDALQQLPAISVATPVRPPSIPTDIFTPEPPPTSDTTGKCPPTIHRLFLPRLDMVIY